jgi:type IV secretory pathway component VirB8
VFLELLFYKFIHLFSAQTFELVNVSKLTAAEIAAIVVSILLVIAITAVVIICCITRGKFK